MHLQCGSRREKEELRWRAKGQEKALFGKKKENGNLFLDGRDADLTHFTTCGNEQLFVSRTLLVPFVCIVGNYGEYSDTTLFWSDPQLNENSKVILCSFCWFLWEQCLHISVLNQILGRSLKKKLEHRRGRQSPSTGTFCDWCSITIFQSTFFLPVAKSALFPKIK